MSCELCPPAKHLPVTIVSRLSLVAADLLVVVVTWSPTYERAMAVRAALGKKRTTLSWIVFRDGLIYFMCVLTGRVVATYLAVTKYCQFLERW